MNLSNESNNIENLIHEYLKGIISEKEKDDLFRWLVQNPSNLAYFNNIADIWLSASVFQDTQQFNPNTAFERVKAKIEDVNALVKEPKRLTIQLSWQWAAAILIGVILLSGISSRLLMKDKTQYSASSFLFEVPYGSKSTVNLPDGTKVVLNAGSKLTCREGFGTTHRLINLVGEGYFSVAKNKHIPFIVHAGNLNVKALGTEFNVKAYPEDKNIETILIHGSIEVNKTSEKNKKEKALVLLPKQTLVYNKASDNIEVIITVEKDKTSKEELLPVAPKLPKVVFAKSSIDPVIYTSWKDLSWYLYRKDLSDLAVELERKYDVSIHFETDALKKIKFTGTLKDESLEQVLAAISLASPIEYKIKGKLVHLNENKELMRQYKQYYSNP